MLTAVSLRYPFVFAYIRINIDFPIFAISFFLDLHDILSRNQVKNQFEQKKMHGTIICDI